MFLVVKQYTNDVNWRSYKNNIKNQGFSGHFSALETLGLVDGKHQ